MQTSWASISARRSYILGFPKEAHALHVQKCTTMKSRMFISNHHPDNVGHEISFGLKKRGVDIRDASLESIHCGYHGALEH